MHTRRWYVVATLCLALGAVAPARAEFAGVPDKIQLWIGGQAASFTTEGGLSLADAGTGVSINFEDIFDLPGSKQSLRGEGTWRITGRSLLDFGLVQFNRSHSAVTDKDVDWGEYTFQEGAYVTATFDSRFVYAAYRYDFLNLDQVRISGSAGLSYLTLTAGLEASASVIGPDGPVAGGVNKEADVKFPVPLVGLQVDWAIRDRLTVLMFVRLFNLDYGKINGGMRESALRMKWHFTRNVGAALGVDTTTVRLKEYETEKYKAKFNYQISGLSAYLTLAF
jgi:hypothetical protein